MTLMRPIIFLLLLLIYISPTYNFVLNSIDLDESTFQTCTYCDERSDRAGSRAASNALREYMTRNHVDIILNKRDVKLEKNLPNENINTGHSCKYRAEARNVKGLVQMLPGTVQLGPEGVGYFDEIKNSFAAVDVMHTVSVEYDVRVRGGFKLPFGGCNQLWRKTCHTDGFAEGTNHISVNFAASNVLVECIAGQEHLTMTVDATVENEAKDKTYSDVVAGKKNNCDLKVFGIKIGSINSKIKDYANRYLKGNEGIRTLRGPELVRELERVLRADLGSKVTIPITLNGQPRSCSSRRRRGAPGGGAPRCTQRKTCPAGYTRIGNQDKCQKYMGTTRPNCTAKGSTVYTRPFGRRTLYWCHAPMV